MLPDRVAYMAAALALAFCVGLLAGRADPEPMPTCAEDVVIVGVGNFEHGQWDAYACGPAVDNYSAGA